MGNQQGNNSGSGKQPVKKFRMGGVTATVWENEGTSRDGKPTTFNTIGVERSYKDKKGEWQKTSTLRISDLPKMESVCRKAFNFLVSKDKDNGDLDDSE